MSYQHHWTNQDAAGHVNPGDFIAAADVAELADAINRRMKLLFNPTGNWPVSIPANVGGWIFAAHPLAVRGWFANLLPTPLSYFQHGPGWDQLYTPLYWLCPQAGPDEDKIIVRDTKPPIVGEVGFFAKLNGLTGWTNLPLAGDPVRAIDINELRDAAALLSRGRFVLRVGDGGEALASNDDPPGGLWYPPAVARSSSGHELHSWFGGREWLWDSAGGGYFGTRGQAVTVRPTSKIRMRPLGADRNIKLYHCAGHLEPWNFTWSQGQAATGDHLGDFSLTDNVWTEWSNSAFVALLQQMADGQVEPSFKIAPNQLTGWADDPIHIDIDVVVDFDLNSPPK